MGQSQSLSSCFGCVSESKMEPPKEANNIELQTITEDGIVKIAEDLPKDFGTCPVCGVWVDTLLH